MSFQKKAFLSIFVTTATLLLALAFSVEELQRDAVESQYLEHYGSMAQVIGDTLRQMEAATARISGGSARTLFNITRSGHLPSEEELKEIKKGLGISQLVITDKHGAFLRDTDTPPEKRAPSIFDFCAGYRDLLRDRSRIETTPILPSYPSGQAYMFSMMANARGDGIVEAGVHVNFIVETLGKAMSSDRSIVSIGLYTPKGVPLGYISQSTGEASSAAQPLTHLSPGNQRRGGNLLEIVTRVPAMVETCCECAQKKLTGDDGRYFYYLRTEVTLNPLFASHRELRMRVLAVLAVALLFALALSHWVSSLLVRRLSLFREGVRQVVATGDLSRRVSLPGGDEIADLANYFDEITANLDRTQRSVIQAEKNRALAEVAKQVAHDIRSPLAALKAATHQAADGGQADRQLIRTAAGRIHEIAENLLSRYREGGAGGGRDGGKPSESLLQVIESALDEKRAELGGEGRVQLEFRAGPRSYDLFTGVPASELKRVLSNLLNNSVEAMSNGGRVSVSLREENGRARLTVEDNGKGIAPELLPGLMRSGATHGKAGGSGLGLAHARETVEGGGGSIHLLSERGKGTRIEIELPRAPAPPWFLAELRISSGHTVVVVDDDQSVHRIWKKRFTENAPPASLVHCFGTDELGRQAELLGAGPNVLYLVDQEIAGSAETGLEAIERLGIQARAILVTSHADDAAVAARCLSLGMRLLPKALAALVPMRLDT